MLERQCHHTLSLFCMCYYFSVPSTQTKCKAQDCNQNLALVKSHLWTSGCSCETVWTIHEAADGKLKQHGLPDLQDSQMSPETHRSPRPSAETRVFLHASRVTLRTAQPGHLLQAPCREHTATAPSVSEAEAWPQTPHFHDTWWAARAQPVNLARTDRLNPQEDTVTLQLALELALLERLGFPETQNIGSNPISPEYEYNYATRKILNTGILQ